MHIIHEMSIKKKTVAHELSNKTKNTVRTIYFSKKKSITSNINTTNIKKICLGRKVKSQGFLTTCFLGPFMNLSNKIHH